MLITSLYYCRWRGQASVWFHSDWWPWASYQESSQGSWKVEVTGVASQARWSSLQRRGQQRDQGEVGWAFYQGQGQVRRVQEGCKIQVGIQDRFGGRQQDPGPWGAGSDEASQLSDSVGGQSWIRAQRKSLFWGIWYLLHINHFCLFVCVRHDPLFTFFPSVFVLYL